LYEFEIYLNCIMIVCIDYFIERFRIGLGDLFFRYLSICNNT